MCFVYGLQDGSRHCTLCLRADASNAAVVDLLLDCGQTFMPSRPGKRVNHLTHAPSHAPHPSYGLFCILLMWCGAAQSTGVVVVLIPGCWCLAASLMLVGD